MPEQVQQLEHSETQHQARKGTCRSSHGDSPDTAKGEIQRSVQAKAKNAMRPNQSVHPCAGEPSNHSAASAEHLREHRVLLNEAAELFVNSLEGQGVEAQDDSERLLDGDEQVIHLQVEAVPHGELLRTGCPDEVLRGVKCVIGDEHVDNLLGSCDLTADELEFLQLGILCFFVNFWVTLAVGCLEAVLLFLHLSCKPGRCIQLLPVHELRTVLVTCMKHCNMR
mmetsp:Transcript_13715/g.37767  ORF Transcript_13715/g.37767 Transcript_13715/m.37767 type:complete len:224 (+) Transcript_13715:213-884(+)